MSRRVRVTHVASALLAVARDLDPCDCPTVEAHERDPDKCRSVCDVRLQCEVGPRGGLTGAWDVHYGPSDYDQDHSGAWGADSVHHGMTWRECKSLARDMLDQAADMAAQSR